MELQMVALVVLAQTRRTAHDDTVTTNHVPRMCSLNKYIRLCFFVGTYTDMNTCTRARTRTHVQTHTHNHMAGRKAHCFFSHFANIQIYSFFSSHISRYHCCPRRGRRALAYCFGSKIRQSVPGLTDTHSTQSVSTTTSPNARIY